MEEDSPSPPPCSLAGGDLGGKSAGGVSRQGLWLVPKLGYLAVGSPPPSAVRVGGLSAASAARSPRIVRADPGTGGHGNQASSRDDAAAAAGRDGHSRVAAIDPRAQSVGRTGNAGRDLALTPAAHDAGDVADAEEPDPAGREKDFLPPQRSSIGDFVAAAVGSSFRVVAPV